MFGCVVFLFVSMDSDLVNEFFLLEFRFKFGLDGI